MGMGERIAMIPRSLRRRPIPMSSAAIAALAFGAYIFVSWTQGLDPGSALGLAFGIGAAVALVVVMLYSIRRALPAVRSLGRSQIYLRIHLWGGALFLLLFLLHTDFRVPAGVFTTILWVTAAWVVVSGAIGLVLQRWVPRILGPSSSFEVHIRRIPELVGELRGRAEAAAASAGPRVEAFYQRELAADLVQPRMVGIALFSGPARSGSEDRSVQLLRKTLPEDGAASLDELLEIRGVKREMDVHFTLQKILRWWLSLHLPFAIVLLGLVALHVFFTSYY